MTVLASIKSLPLKVPLEEENPFSWTSCCVISITRDRMIGWGILKRLSKDSIGAEDPNETPQAS